MSPLGQLTSLDIATAMRYDSNKKQVFIAYLLWFFLGWAGGHRFYAGRSGSAVTLLLLTLFSSLLAVVGIGLLGLAIVAIWWFIDAFLIPDMIRSHNNSLIDLLTSRQATA